MKAIQFEHYGEPSFLKINKIQPPLLKSGQVLGQVKALVLILLTGSFQVARCKKLCL